MAYGGALLGATAPRRSALGATRAWRGGGLKRREMFDRHLRAACASEGAEEKGIIIWRSSRYHPRKGQCQAERRSDP